MAYSSTAVTKFIRTENRAEGEASWADQVHKVRLACNKETRKKVVLEAARGIIISKKGRSDSLRLAQGERELRQRRLIPLPGNLEHEVGTPASL